jgi:DNA-binding NarL/FixJ family response regulator
MARYAIILTDDHPMLRQGLRKIIEGVSDLEVVGEAGDGEELLLLLNAVTTQMVILDLSMPKMRGIEAIHEIKMRHPDVKILVLTMHREYMHQAFAAGADGYLLKEDADRELFSAIENIRKGRRYLSPCLTGEVLTTLLSEPLSSREKEVLTLIADGKSNKEIAELLFISVRTIESHRASILDKLNLKSTADLVKYAIRKGYV